MSAAAGPVAGGSVPPLALPPFEAIVATHGATILRVCRGLVGPHDADDVWQETFLAALRTYPDTTGVLNREAWLVTIARNKAVDHHRRSAHVPEPVESGGEAPLEGGDVVVRSVEAAAEAEVLWSALALLPSTQREAVVYHHLAGLRYAAVAELLGNSEAAARRAAADGMKSLRTHLGRKRKEES